jgi:excisionase family DNA binding protein
MVVKVVELPKGVTPITSRVAAEILDCSMGHVRNLALNEKLRSWKIGARSVIFDLEEVKAYRKSMVQWRKEGHRGKAPGGFKPDE